MIAKMARLEIVCLRSLLDQIVPFLQEWGILHIEEVPLALEQAPGFLHRVHLSQEQKAAAEALEGLDRILGEIVPLLVVRPRADQVAAAWDALEGATIEQWFQFARLWSRDLRSLTRRRLNIRDDIEMLSNYRGVLRAIEPVLIGRKLVLGKGARTVVLVGDAARGVRHLERRLRRALGVETELICCRLGRDHIVGVITYPEEKDRSVVRILSDEGIEPVDPPDKTLRGLPVREALTKLDARIARHRLDLREIEGQLKQLARERGAEIIALRSRVADRLAQLRVVQQFARSNMMTVIHGWAPSSRLEPFRQALEERFTDRVHVGCLPTAGIDRKRIPTLLQNHRMAQPFELLLALFKPPMYGTLDPSFLVGLFFVGFYGFIVGDIGYGLAIVLLSFLVRRYIGRIPAVRSACTVGLYCGISATLFGFLFGEFFGDVGHRLGLRPIWFHRGRDTEKLLVIAISIGAAHVVLSLIIAVVESLRHREMRHALEKLGMLCGLLAVGIGVAGLLGAHPGPAAGCAVLLIVISMVLLIRSSGVLAPLHMLEVLSLVSNVLSYCRLMALGVASIILADLANELGSKAGSLVLGVAIGGLIHVLNLSISLFSPTIHSLRLNYVEFLPKFFSPDGKSYEPFKKEVV